MTATGVDHDDAPSPFAEPGLLPGLKRLAASSRAASSRSAQDAVVLAELALSIPRTSGDERGGSAWTSFLREVAVARRCSDRAARAEVAVALQLMLLPNTLALLAAGDLPVTHARALVEESWPASDATLARIDAEVAARAVRLPPSRIRDAVRKVLLREEADAVATRAAKAAAARAVRRSPLADDQAEIALSGPAAPLAQAYQALDDDARALRAAGDGRALDALRFDLACERLLAGHAVRAPGSIRAGAHDGADAASSPGPASSDDADGREGASARDGDVGPQPEASAGVPPTGRPVPPSPATGGPEWLADRRWSRPVRLNITVPVTTALGLSDEPGWLDGHGWISAPTCRQLLVSAELRQLCTHEETGELVDLAEQVVRPDRTPEAVADALRDMATRPFDLTATPWRTEDQHDPSDPLREFVVLRDQLCDGPTGARVPARRAHLDHDRPWSDGPTAAWNLAARGERTHVLKHRGWQPVRTATSTLWFSPAGQVVEVARTAEPLRALESDARLPDPAELFALEAELLRPPTSEDDPPDW